MEPHGVGGGIGRLKSKKILISLVVLILFGIFVTHYMTSESRVEYYAKRVPPGTTLYYINLDKLSSANAFQDVYSHLQETFSEAYSKTGINFQAIGAKEAVVVTPSGDINDAIYSIFAGKLDTNYLNNMIAAKVRESNSFVNSYNYDGFEVYESPSQYENFFFAYSNQYLVIGGDSYLANYPVKYVLDLLSGKDVDHSLYAQCKGLISRLPAGAVVYLVDTHPSESFVAFGDIHGVTAVGIAVLASSGGKIKNHVVVQCLNKDIAKKVLYIIQGEYYEHSDRYTSFRIKQDGKYIIIEYTTENYTT